LFFSSPFSLLCQGHGCVLIDCSVLGTYLIGVGRVFEKEKEKEKERNFLFSFADLIRQLFLHSKCLFL